MVEQFVEFRVMYKSNGEKPKGLKGPVGKKGMHGKFFNEDGDVEEAKQLAESAAETCRRWFNWTKTVSIKMNERGDPVETFSEFEHEIADVWIDEYRDGKLFHSGESGWSAESSAKESSTSKHTSGEKSQSSLSTASA